MPYDARLALRRARRTGVLICLVTLALAALFVLGLVQHSYWALAIPVAVGVLSVLWVSFWIGYTIATVRGIPPEADHYESRRARRIALVICGASVAVAVVFLAGVVRQSYWALALPVALAVLGLAAMVFWIGWAIVTQRSTLAEPNRAPFPEPPVAAEELEPGDPAATDPPP